MVEVRLAYLEARTGAERIVRTRPRRVGLVIWAMWRAEAFLRKSSRIYGRLRAVPIRRCLESPISTRYNKVRKRPSGVP